MATSRQPGAPVPWRAVRVLVVLCVAVALIAGCSDEEATPVDLSSSGGASTSAPAADPPAGDQGGAPAVDGEPPPTPHAIGESPQARAYAEEQCRDDPEAERGVVRIVDPSTQRVVGEVIVDCAEVRSTSE